MKTMRKTGIAAIVIILAASNLTGKIGEIKATGSLLIPTASGEKLYKGVITITRTEIEIECDKKIFRPFNEFEVPKQAKIRVNTVEVERICIQENDILILPGEPLYRRYRYLFHEIMEICFWCFPYKKALIFSLDNRADIGPAGIEIFRLINKQSRE